MLRSLSLSSRLLGKHKSSLLSIHVERLSRCELWWRLYRVPVVAALRRLLVRISSSFQHVICGAVKTKKMKTHYVSEILPSSHSKQEDAKTILIQQSHPPPPLHQSSSWFLLADYFWLKQRRLQLNAFSVKNLRETIRRYYFRSSVLRSNPLVPD